MVDKIAYHPDGSHTIQFLEGPHTYTDNQGAGYISGTSFIGKFFHKFDSIAVSEKCSSGSNPKYSGRKPADIRAEWAKEGERGSLEGNNVHEYAELRMLQSATKPAPISDRCELLFKQVDKITSYLLTRYIFIAAEMIVFSPLIGIAGMVDLVMLDQKTNEILILDWKQNKNSPTTFNSFQSGFKPIEHLQQTDINKFSLQLSLYQHIMLSENYFPYAAGFRRAIIHITPKAATPIKLEYYEYEIKEMIKYESSK